MRCSKSKAPQDKFISLWDRRLTNQDIIRLLQTLDPDIKTLSVGVNKIGDVGAQALAENTTLTTLDIPFNKIGNTGAQALAENTTLTTLVISHNKIGNYGVQALAKNTTLTTLDVSYNKISALGAQALAKNTTLTTLNVSNNKIGALGAQALANNKTLTTLNVSFNNIGDVGAQALANNKTLTTLNVAGNEISDVGAQALAKNTILTTLDIPHNNIGDSGVQALAKNKTLTTLNISYNEIGDDGAQDLAKNTTLITLNVSNNKIGDSGIRAFIDNNNTLLKLNVSLNPITLYMLKKVEAHIKMNKERLKRAFETLEKRGTFKRKPKEFPIPIESTGWMDICREFGTHRLYELKEIARQVGIKTTGKTKRELCMELAQQFESFQPKTPKSSGCYNETDFLGDSFDEMSPLVYTSYSLDGKIKYCISLTDMAGLEPDFIDPFTRKHLPQDVIDWYDENKDVYNIHELKTTKRGSKRDEAMFIADILNKHEKLVYGIPEFVPNTTKYFEVDPLLADKQKIDEYRKDIKTQELVRNLGFSDRFQVGSPIDEYYIALLDTLKETRESSFENLESLKWLYVSVMNDLYFNNP